MTGAEKILNCHDKGNFITAVDLQLKRVTPKEMEEFNRENDLVWAALSLGPILGNIVMFYKRNPAIDDEGTTVAHQIDDRTPIGDEEFSKIKLKYGIKKD